MKSFQESRAHHFLESRSHHRNVFLPFHVVAVVLGYNYGDANYVADLSSYPFPDEPTEDMIVVDTYLYLYGYYNSLEVPGVHRGPGGSFLGPATAFFLGVYQTGAINFYSFGSYADSTYLPEGYHTKVRVYGPAQGVVCQYSTKDYTPYGYGDFFPQGDDEGMLTVPAASASDVSVGAGSYFDFSSTDTPALGPTEWSSPAVAVFWPNKRASDFGF